MRRFVLWLVAGVSFLGVRGAAQQPDDDSVPLARRMLLAGSTTYDRQRLTNGVWNDISGSFAMRSFVNDAVQVGVAPSYQVTHSPFNHTSADAYGGGTVNFGMNIPFGLRAYAGVYSFTFLNSNASPWYRAGIQGGVMRFFGPSVALRLEERLYGYSSNAYAPPIRETILSLDPYLIRDDPVHPALPDRGTVEIAGSADVMTEPWGERSVSFTIAPFVTRWLQVGTDMSITSELPTPAYTVHTENAIVRLYAPYSPAFMPFIGGFVTSSTSGNFDGGLSSYGGSIGVRHALDRAIAADLGMHWTAYPHLFPDRLSLFAKLVLLVRAK